MILAVKFCVVICFTLIVLEILMAQQINSCGMFSENGEAPGRKNREVSAAKVLKEGHLQRENQSHKFYLDFQYCSIKSIEFGAFRGGDKIVNLELENNLLEQLDPTVFKELPLLKYLGLSDNPLEGFLNVFPVLNITNLNLRDCRVRFIQPMLFSSLKMLKFLDLRNNQLRTLEWRVFYGLGMLEEALLYGNPWRCDCHLKFLLNFLEESKTDYLYFRSAVTCSTSLQNYHVTSIPKGLEWEDKSLEEELACPPKITELRIVDNVVNIHLKCSYYGFPPPEVKWFKNNKLLNTTSPIILNKGLNRAAFEVKFNTNFSETIILGENGDMEDGEGGTYTCFVYNAGGNTRKSEIFHSTAEATPVKVEEQQKDEEDRLIKFNSCDGENTETTLVKPSSALLGSSRLNGEVDEGEMANAVNKLKELVLKIEKMEKSGNYYLNELHIWIVIGSLISIIGLIVMFSLIIGICFRRSFSRVSRNISSLQENLITRRDCRRGSLPAEVIPTSSDRQEGGVPEYIQLALRITD